MDGIKGKNADRKNDRVFARDTRVPSHVLLVLETFSAAMTH